MVITSTPYLTCGQISTGSTDILEDAYGLKSEYADVYEFLGNETATPGDELVNKLLILISNGK
ncbi:MAG: hypothetical protein U0X39_13075 [Bacteroidales bacterium]